MAALLLCSRALPAEIIRNPEEFSPNPEDYSAAVVLFYSDGCGVCHELMGYLDGVEESNPGLTLYYFTKPNAPDGSPVDVLYTAFRTQTGTEGSGVPRYFINGKAFIGYSGSDRESKWMEGPKAWNGTQRGVDDEIEKLLGGPVAEGKKSIDWFRIAVVAILFGLLLYSVIRSGGRMRWVYLAVFASVVSLVFLMARIDVARMASLVDRIPFPAFVSAIALVDGFNPCAFTALFLMLSVLTGLDRSSLTAAVGGIFAGVSGMMYFVFMLLIILGERLVFSFIGLNLYRVIGLVVGAAGVMNLWSGLELNTKARTGFDEDQLSFIGRRTAAIRRLAEKERTASRNLSVIAAATVLAALVNLIELGCTAILPSLYAGALLARYGVAVGVAHIGWTALYAVIYVVPLAAILVSFLLLSKSRRMNPKTARSMKMAGAAFMLPMGLLLLLNPGLLFH